MTVTNQIGGVLDSGSFDSPKRVGYKIGLMSWNKGDVQIVPPTYYSLTTGLDADSQCRRKHPDASSFAKCSCGFYAYNSIASASHHLRRGNQHASNGFMLEVSLSGTVIVAERGYNASHQRVKSVVIPPCYICDEQLSTSLVSLNNGLLGKCDKCRAPKEAELITFEEFVAAGSIEGFSPLRVWSSYFDAVSLDRGFNNIELISQVKRGITELAARKDHMGMLELQFMLTELLSSNEGE